jgi:hypothetical protein
LNTVIKFFLKLPSFGWLAIALLVETAVWFLTYETPLSWAAFGLVFLANLHTPVHHWIYRHPPFRQVRAARHRLVRPFVLRFHKPLAYVVISRDDPDGEARMAALRAFVAAHPASRYLKIKEVDALAVGVPLASAPALFRDMDSEVGFRYSPREAEYQEFYEPSDPGLRQPVYLSPENYLEESDYAALRDALPPQAEIFDPSLLSRVMDNMNDMWPWDSL